MTFFKHGEVAFDAVAPVSHAYAVNVPRLVDVTADGASVQVGALSGTVYVVVGATVVASVTVMLGRVIFRPVYAVIQYNS